MKNRIKVMALRKGLGLVMVWLGSTNLPAQGTWSQQASYGGDERAFGFAFVVDVKAYVGGGASYGGSRNDEELWAYDPAGNAWAGKADLPLVPYRAEAMAVGSYGYLIAGVNRSGNWVTEVWQYNPASYQWLQKNNFRALCGLTARPLPSTTRAITAPCRAPA